MDDGRKANSAVLRTDFLALIIEITLLQKYWAFIGH